MNEQPPHAGASDPQHKPVSHPVPGEASAAGASGVDRLTSDERLGIWLLRVLVTLACASLVWYYAWWKQPGRIRSPELALLLALAAGYSLFQLAASWALYLSARRRPAVAPARAPRSIDVFVTTCGEPIELVTRSLTAACRMRGAHRTWLLDDARVESLAELARSLGAGYLTRPDRVDHKAGNVNAALPRTSGDIVVVFDVDHVPQPEFLERTVGLFDDPRIGFVQVMLTFSNEHHSFTARASSESSYDFYNPTSMGADRWGAPTMIGSNALIRRSALQSIGGYRPGLAEDLATSMALHAQGWRSAYVAEPLAPGLAPPDITGWFHQQLKWSRGVFEVLLTEFPRAFFKLRGWDRLTYAARLTHYWIGPFFTVHLLFLLAMLLGGRRVAHIDFEAYLMHLAPFVVMSMCIQRTAVHFFRHPSIPSRVMWRPMCLVVATWPVYTLAWLMAIARVPLRFLPTPKAVSGHVSVLWLLPQICALLLLASAACFALVMPQPDGLPVTLLAFAALQAIPMLVLLLQAWREKRSADLGSGSRRSSGRSKSGTSRPRRPRRGRSGGASGQPGVPELAFETGGGKG